jgi:hypothetical protein
MAIVMKFQVASFRPQPTGEFGRRFLAVDLLNPKSEILNQKSDIIIIGVGTNLQNPPRFL